MPHRNGFEVLRWIRDTTVLRCLPVFMFSSSAQPAEVDEAYESGANGYFVKPTSTGDRRDLARLLRDWLALNEPPLASLAGFKSAQQLRATGKVRHR
jgi:CheY-like chemotaxis protein